MGTLCIHKENSEFQIVQSLKTNRAKRKKLGEMFIEGTECIKQAIAANMEITRIIVRNDIALSDWGKDTIKKYGHIKTIEMSGGLYEKLSDKVNPPEMLATAKIKSYVTDDIIDEHPFIVLFDRPSDCGNLGSVIRSANAFGVSGIFILGHGIDIYESKVIRASLGSIFFTKIVQIESMEILAKYIASQKTRNNMEIIGTDSNGTVSLKNYEPKRPIMLIIGNESKGMSKKLIEICDKIIKIPMEGNVNSLNVSCAASIMMWEIYKNTK